MDQAIPHDLVWYDEEGIFPTGRRLAQAQKGLIAKKDFRSIVPIRNLQEEVLVSFQARLAYLSLEMEEVESYCPPHLS